jgi:hypothetical protein
VGLNGSLKLVPARVETWTVPFVHECLFCGYSRSSAAAAIVRPVCEHCGCVLVSSPSSGREEVAMPVLDRGTSVPPLLASLAKALAAAAVMTAATKAGFDAGGPWIAGVGFSVSGLVALPALVPES